MEILMLQTAHSDILPWRSGLPKSCDVPNPYKPLNSTAICMTTSRRVKHLRIFQACDKSVTLQESCRGSLQDAIGEAILATSRVVPDGLLCFMPSYSLLDRLSQRWQVQ